MKSSGMIIYTKRKPVPNRMRNIKQSAHFTQSICNEASDCPCDLKHRRLFYGNVKSFCACAYVELEMIAVSRAHMVPLHICG